ncbi:hypothetical protein POVWA1_060940 [Plasmodium ovale wallikeri]|uniref:Uncharacterized protein n=1 Tax=Plasmodium ovale wallikeri TaxID=864142 RepID=A0A1A9A203_PLAOA|nr:hypothetical protein POVWA1_060940 [Plasmodium ovale wallikeri]
MEQGRARYETAKKIIAANSVNKIQPNDLTSNCGTRRYAAVRGSTRQYAAVRGSTRQYVAVRAISANERENTQLCTASEQ